MGDTQAVSNYREGWGKVFRRGAAETRTVGLPGLSSLFVLILKWLKSTEREGKRSFCFFFFSPNLKNICLENPAGGRDLFPEFIFQKKLLRKGNEKAGELHKKGKCQVPMGTHPRLCFSS